MPTTGTTAEQTQLLSDLATKGFDGIAVAPLDPKGEAPAIDDLAALTNVLCWDLDSPTSRRLAFVGLDNVAAGEQVGRRVVELLPQGGRIGVFVGLFTAKSAVDRVKGIEQAIAGHGITITVRAADSLDRAKARLNVEDALTANTIDLAVGLWSYDGPAIASTIQVTHAKVKAVAFDDEPATLAAVRNGTIQATCVQDPARLAYQTLTVMRDLAVTGDAAKLPPGGTIDPGTMLVDKSNVDTAAPAPPTPAR
jgi:ribose transport system substrate-binding protein